MAIKDILKKNVPEHLQQTLEFPIILKLVSDAKISSPDSLKHWLNVELEKCKNDLTECGKAGPTANRKRVRIADKIELLHLVRDRILPYVK